MRLTKPFSKHNYVLTAFRYELNDNWGFKIMGTSFLSAFMHHFAVNWGKVCRNVQLGREPRWLAKPRFLPSVDDVVWSHWTISWLVAIVGLNMLKSLF